MLSSLSQHQATNILNGLHAGFELRLPVSSSTCRFRPFPVAAGLRKIADCWRYGVDVSLPAQWIFKVKCNVRSIDPILHTCGSSAMAQQAGTVTVRSIGRRFFLEVYS